MIAEDGSVIILPGMVNKNDFLTGVEERKKYLAVVKQNLQNVLTAEQEKVQEPEGNFLNRIFSKKKAIATADTTNIINAIKTNINDIREEEEKLQYELSHANLKIDEKSDSSDANTTTNTTTTHYVDTLFEGKDQDDEEEEEVKAKEKPIQKSGASAKRRAKIDASETLSEKLLTLHVLPRGHTVYHGSQNLTLMNRYIKKVEPTLIRYHKEVVGTVATAVPEEHKEALKKWTIQVNYNLGKMNYLLSNDERGCPLLIVDRILACFIVESWYKFQLPTMKISFLLETIIKEAIKEAENDEYQ